MYLKPGKYHPNDPGKSINSPETIHRSPSGFIGGKFQLNKSAEHASRVTYTYGPQGAPHNSAGRLVSRRDESGSIAYRYGLMGEVTYEQRSLERLTPLEPERSAAMRYRSDYLGRMASITYPDGEKITYTYDPGGQVTGIQAARSDGTQTILVKKIGYDQYGQRTYLEYGNGNITTYTYDEQRRWMDTLKTQNTRSGVTLQNLTYRFDTVGNVLSRGEVTSRYSTSQNYTYDALYQLTGALGDYTERPAGIDDWRQEYSQNFSYDALGNITQKTSTQTRFPQSSGALNLNYQLNYEYDENKPRQATKIGEMYYGYDPNGNLIEESVIPVGHSRAGQAANITQIGKVKIADRGFGLVNNPEDDASLYRRMFSWDEENRLKKVQDPSNTVRFLYDAEGMRTVKHSREGETLYYNTWWSETEDLPGFRRSKHIYLGSERIVSRLSIEEAGPNYEDLNTYYYHPDHLGSVHSVSDSEGNPYERIEYTPYGEMWIEIREDANTKNLNYIPYRFTSKEWDSETGLYSFPARYFEPKLSRWMSADPAGFELMNPMEEDREGKLKPRQGYSMIESTNWYAYTANNPVKFVDPTGMEIVVQAHLVMFGNYHLSIKITPENQENYKDNERFKDNIDAAGNHYATLGAGPMDGKLVSNLNRDTDIDRPKVETITLDLKGRDEDAVITDLFEADLNYQDDAGYKLFPKKEDEGSGHNSNSYVSGLLKAIRLDPPDVKSNTPGYDKPLPDINFYHDSWMPPNNEEE